MKGIRINFGDSGASLDFTQPVEDFAGQIQNGLVNIGTMKGTDPLYPDRGTDLFRAALNAALVDLNSAQHYSNFAALDTLFFSRATDYDGTVSRLNRVILEPVVFDGRNLKLDAQFVSSDGVTVGTINSIQS